MGRKKKMERWGIFVKKHLIFLWTLGLLLACLIPVGASAEGEEPCEHTYTFVSNEDGTHTEKCSKCGDAHEPTGCSLGDYVFDTNTETHSKTCSACGYKQTGACSFSGFTHDVGKQTHSRTCSVCNGTQSQGCTYSNYTHISDTNTHTKECTVCGDEQTVACEFASYTHIVLTNTHTKKCIYCENLQTENCAFTGFTSDGDALTHSKQCTRCGNTITEGCTFGDYAHVAGSETHKRTCSICGNTPVEACSFGNYTHIDGEEKHSKTCSKCGDIQKEACSGGTPSCNEKAKCSSCGAPYGQPQHTGPRSYQSSSNGTHTVRCSACDEVVETGVSCSTNLPQNAATCTKKAKCDLCEGSYGEPLGHLLGSNGCQRTNCDCTVNHNSLWVAGDTSVTCAECGKRFDATPVSSIAFNVTGYGYGLPISGLEATTETSGVQVTSVTATAETRARSATFEAGKPYRITVAYSILPGYVKASTTIPTTINGNPVDENGAVTFAALEQVFTITYNLGGGTHSNPTSYTASQLPLALQNPTKANCTFNGWTGDTDKLDANNRIKEGTTGNLTFTANWKATVTFDKNGHGNETASQIVECGKKCPTPADPIDADYVFQGWYTEAACTNRYDFATPVTQNITLYAKWAEAYTLTFVGNGGTDFGSIQVEKNSTVDLTKYKPVRSGYWFYGWYRTEALKSTDRVSFLKMDADKAVYAKWKKIDPTNPRTGDAQHPELAGGILVLSALGLGAAVTGRKRRKI